MGPPPEKKKGRVETSPALSSATCSSSLWCPRGCGKGGEQRKREGKGIVHKDPGSPDAEGQVDVRPRSGEKHVKSLWMDVCGRREM